MFDLLIISTLFFLITGHYLVTRYGSQIFYTAKILFRSNAFTYIVNDTQKSVTFIYQRNGKVYHLIVPYDRSLIPVATGKRVFLVKNEDEMIEITQQPGIPYLVTAEEILPNSRFLVEDLETDNLTEINENKDMFRYLS